MRIALAQINPTLGDFALNAAKIIEFTLRAASKRADVVVFPELSLFGYPPNDCLESYDNFQKQEAFISKILSKIPKGITCIFGAVVPNSKKTGKPFQNSAVVAQKGKKPQIFAKQLLPTYDIFDEGRFFEPGDSTGVLKIKNVGNVALTICEDLWCGIEENGKKIYSKNILNQSNIDLIVNISASPFSKNQESLRLQNARFHVARVKAPLVYVNQVGGQDELIFDGRSFVLNKKGQVIVQAATCEEDLVIIDLGNNLTEYRPSDEDKNEILRKSLVLGLRDFMKKTGQKKIHLGLSGGIDSAVCAALAVDAIGPGNVTGLLLPGPYSSGGSVTDSEKLAQNLGIKTIKIDINELYGKGLKAIAEFGIEKTNSDLTEQNIQARFRGLVLMAYSNRSQSMLISTSNKSELAAGYATLYGDMCGGLMPIGDLLKFEVYGLAKVYNQNRELIPKAIIKKAPSAELAPDQRDDDTLPPYEELDKAVVRIVEQKKIPKTQTEKWLYQAIRKSEFKRWQAPPILRVSEHSFGRGRRMPIAGKF
jgi:NAD+ synthase (glutamine-hydrolysing)